MEKYLFCKLYGWSLRRIGLNNLWTTDKTLFGLTKMSFSPQISNNVGDCGQLSGVIMNSEFDIFNFVLHTLFLRIYLLNWTQISMSVYHTRGISMDILYMYLVTFIGRFVLHGWRLVCYWLKRLLNEAFVGLVKIPGLFYIQYVKKSLTYSTWVSETRW